MPSGVEISNALASGTVDVGLFGTFPFLTAVARGVPVVLIGHTWNNALKNPQSEILSVIARADAGVPVGDLAKLKGKKIGVTRGAGGEPYIAGLLKQAGLTMDDVTLVEHGAVEHGDRARQQGRRRDRLVGTVAERRADQGARARTR